jgi:hypothetical protein
MKEIKSSADGLRVVIVANGWSTRMSRSHNLNLVMAER